MRSIRLTVLGTPKPYALFGSSETRQGVKTGRKCYRSGTSEEEAEIAIREIWGPLPAFELQTDEAGSDE